MNDMSIKEEDREIDIESYASGSENENKSQSTETEKEKAEETGIDDSFPVDIDKVYEEE